MTTTQTPAPLTRSAASAAVLRAIRAHDEHLRTCEHTARRAELVDDGWQTTLRDRCPEASALWAAVGTARELEATTYRRTA